MKDEEFLKAMRIQPVVIPEPTPATDQAAIEAFCEGDWVHMALGDLNRLIAANRSMYADRQAFEREAAAALMKAEESAKAARVWASAFLLLAVGVAAVTVWGVVR